MYVAELISLNIFTGPWKRFDIPVSCVIEIDWCYFHFRLLTNDSEEWIKIMKFILMLCDGKYRCKVVGKTDPLK